MAQTPVTTQTAYCSPAELLAYVDFRVVADALKDDDGPRPSKASVLDATTEQGATLATLCLAGSGDLEAACLVRSLYSPEDLAALTGAGKAHLERVAAGLTLLALFGRRMPGKGKPDDWAVCAVAREAVEKLRSGERVFGTAENRDAGAGVVAVESVEAADDPDRTVTRARRYFGGTAR